MRPLWTSDVVKPESFGSGAHGYKRGGIRLTQNLSRAQVNLFHEHPRVSTGLCRKRRMVFLQDLQAGLQIVKRGH